jgi:hypothetical protein
MRAMNYGSTELPVPEWPVPRCEPIDEFDAGTWSREGLDGKIRRVC